MIAIVKSLRESLVDTVRQRVGSLFVRSTTLSPRMTLTEFFDAWFLSVILRGEHNADDLTVESYQISLRYWREATGDPALNRIDPHALAKLRNHLRAATYKRGPNSTPKPLSSHTIAKHERQICTIMGRVGKSHNRRTLCAGVAVDLPYLKTTVPGKHAPKLPLSLEQCRATIAAAWRLPNESDRMKWVWFLAAQYYTGSRFSAALMISPSMFSERNGQTWLTIPGRLVKTGNDFIKPVHADLNALRARMPVPAASTNPYVAFGCHKRTLTRHHDRLQLEAGITKSLGWHAWRRAHGEQMAFTGADAGQRAAQVALDHSSSAITKESYCNAHTLLIHRLPSVLPDGFGYSAAAA